MKLGLIAGNGRFPFLVLDAAVAQGHDVTIVADSALRWEEVVSIMDACKKADFTAGFGAPPDLGQ